MTDEGVQADTITLTRLSADPVELDDTPAAAVKSETTAFLDW